jgi:hypothetical protein
MEVRSKVSLTRLAPPNRLCASPGTTRTCRREALRVLLQEAGLGGYEDVESGTGGGGMHAEVVVVAKYRAEVEAATQGT